MLFCWKLCRSWWCTWINNFESKGTMLLFVSSKQVLRCLHEECSFKSFHIRRQSWIILRYLFMIVLISFLIFAACFNACFFIGWRLGFFPLLLFFLVPTHVNMLPLLLLLLRSLSGEEEIFQCSGTIIESFNTYSIILTTASLLRCSTSRNSIADNVKVGGLFLSRPQICLIASSPNSYLLIS